MRWINLYKVSSKHTKLSNWTAELKVQLSSIVKLLTIPLSSVYLILHWYSYKASKTIAFPPVFGTSQFSPSPHEQITAVERISFFSLLCSQLSYIVPSLGLLCSFYTHWPSGFFASSAALCGFQISLTRPSLCVPKQGNCWFSLQREGRNITTIFSPLFLLWNGDTILISYLNIFFLHILYQTAEVKMGSKQFTNVYCLSAYCVNYSPWYFLALLTEWDFTISIFGVSNTTFSQ